MLLSWQFYWKMHRSGKECKSPGCCYWLKSHLKKVCEHKTPVLCTVLFPLYASHNTSQRYLFHQHINRDYCLDEIIPGRFLLSSGTFVIRRDNKSDLISFYFRLGLGGFCFSLGVFFFPEGMSTELRLKVEWENFSHS